MSEDNAKPFKDMAETIEHNKESIFGGAIVIVPPADAGGRISTLYLDNAMTAPQFWGSLQAKCQIEIDKLSRQGNTPAAFRQR